MRQNRQDIQVDGETMLAVNAQLAADGSVDYQIHDESFKPDSSAVVGTNFFDRREQILYVVVGGSTVTNVNVAKTLIVEFQSNAIELTADELYGSDLLINYLASLLGIDQSQIKVVDVVTEGQRRRRSSTVYEFGTRGRRATGGNTIIIEILPEAPGVTDETSYETVEGAPKTEVLIHPLIELIKRYSTIIFTV